MAIFATAGAKLYIGPAMAVGATDKVLADFEPSPALSYTEVGMLENLGTLGDASDPINFDAINRNRRMKLKGVKDAGTMNVVCGLDYSDTGQIALRAAEGTPNTYAFKVEFNDAPSSSGSTPSLRYFVAHVMTASESLETANSVMKFNATLGVNSNVVRVNAAA